MEESKNNFDDKSNNNSTIIKKQYTGSKNLNSIPKKIYNNNELEQDEEENEEEDKPSKEIELLFESLLEMYSKKQFKKILKTIILRADKENKFNLVEWKLLFLRTHTLQRILEKKNSFYYKLSKVPHFTEYIQKFDNDINHWLSFTQHLTNKNEKLYVESFLEFIILFLLKKILILSKHYIQFGYIQDAIAILSLGLILIIKSFFFFKSPDSYALAGEIFLYLSSFLIAEGNFETAQNFIFFSIRFCYLSLELKLFKNGINYKVFNLKEYKNELANLSKNFFNLSIGFYQLGICLENDGDSYDAFFAMKASKFFGNILHNENYYLFVDLVKDIETRLLMRNRIIIFFERYVKKEELEEKIIEAKKVYNIFYNQEERREKRFKGIKNFIQKMKLIDVDDEEPDLFNKVGCKPIKPKVLRTTKQLHLLNILMSDDFKDIVNKMKNIEINKLDKDTINKIQKKIISLKNNERAKLEKKNKGTKMILKIENMQKRIESSKKENEDKTVTIKKKSESKTIRSTSLYSFTTSNTKKPRINSAFERINRKKLLIYHAKLNNKTLNNGENQIYDNSIYSSPSRYISLNDNLNSRSKNLFTRDRILSAKKSRIESQKYRNINNNINLYEKKSFSVKLVKEIPKYNYNYYYFNKKFKQKYNFLESQFDREINFQRQLLKTKFIKEEFEKPESVDIKDIHKKVDEFYYTTFQNELMNAKEKQIIFDKIETTSAKKPKIQKKIFITEPKLFYSANLKKQKEYLNPNQITEINDDCINEITNKISKIISQEKLIIQKKRKLLKK